MQLTEIRRRVELLKRVILDFSNVPVRWQPVCREYELAREFAPLREAVAVRRRYNASLVARNGETVQQADERMRGGLNKGQRSELEFSDVWLCDRGWSFLSGFRGFPEKPWKNCPKRWRDPRKDRESREPALHCWGYASEKDFAVVKKLQQAGYEASSAKPFILLQVDLDADNKAMRRDLDRTVAYLRRTYDNIHENRGEARRFGKEGRRSSGGILTFAAFCRGLNAMRVLRGAKLLLLQDQDIVDCIPACGFSGSAKPSKSGQRYPGVEAAKEARDKFLNLFRGFFGSNAVPLTVSDPVGTLNLTA